MDQEIFYGVLNKETLEWTRVGIKLGEVIDATDVWKTQEGQPIIGYKGIKKIADFCNVCIKETPQLVCSPTADNLQSHIWVVRVGFKRDKERDNRVFSEGESSKMNTGKTAKDGKYSERLQKDCMYRSAMAYKRAYVRAVMKLVELHGFYGSDESKDFVKVSKETEEENYSPL